MEKIIKTILHNLFIDLPFIIATILSIYLFSLSVGIIALNIVGIYELNSVVILIFFPFFGMAIIITLLLILGLILTLVGGYIDYLKNIN